jgi:hypothetical protein
MSVRNCHVQSAHLLLRGEVGTAWLTNPAYRITEIAGQAAICELSITCEDQGKSLYGPPVLLYPVL